MTVRQHELFGPRPIHTPMTATQAIALAEIIERGGAIVRQAGGFWTMPGAVKTAIIGVPFDWWLGTRTVDGLVRRGALRYTQWKDGRGGRFPIEARVIDSKLTDAPDAG